MIGGLADAVEVQGLGTGEAEIDRASATKANAVAEWLCRTCYAHGRPRQGARELAKICMHIRDM
jgi:hypothetical protein